MKDDARRGEFIGKLAEVIEAGNRSQLGIRGKIINETKNTITVLDSAGEKKTLVKGTVTIMIGSIAIRGREICAAPEERIKTKRK